MEGLHGLPKRNGKIKDLSHFDASFFGIPPKQANTMDPGLRLLLEVSYEAMIDAGKIQIFNILYIWGILSLDLIKF